MVSRFCSQCAEPLQENASYCSACAAPTSNVGRSCGQCGEPLNANSQFCPGCGSWAEWSITGSSGAAPTSITPPTPIKKSEWDNDFVKGDDELLLEARPSHWKFFWYWVFFWLIIPIIVALWQRASLVLYVYRDRVVLEKGFFSKDIKEVFISDIRTVETKQSLPQRIFRFGDVMIATAGTSGYKDVAAGLPDPTGIRDLLINLKGNLRA